MSTDVLTPPSASADVPPPAATPGRGGGGGGWRPALRIARRTIRRNLGRSLLIVALVGAPVAGATIVDGVYRTFTSPERDAVRELGTADARIEVMPFDRLSSDYYPSPGVGWGRPFEAKDRGPAEVDLGALLPAGTVLHPAPVRYHNLPIERDTSAYSSLTVVSEFDNPAYAHRVTLDSGAWPQHANEIVVTNCRSGSLPSSGSGCHCWRRLWRCSSPAAGCRWCGGSSERAGPASSPPGRAAADSSHGCAAPGRRRWPITRPRDRPFGLRCR